VTHLTSKHANITLLATMFVCVKQLVSTKMTSS